MPNSPFNGLSHSPQILLVFGTIALPDLARSHYPVQSRASDPELAVGDSVHFECSLHLQNTPLQFCIILYSVLSSIKAELGYYCSADLFGRFAHGLAAPMAALLATPSWNVG